MAVIFAVDYNILLATHQIKKNEKMNIVIFIDYDNLRQDQKTSGILSVVNRALMLLPSTLNDPNIECEVRVYGGWYEGSIMTTLAQQISISLQQEFPAIVRVPTLNKVTFRVTAELAVAMIEEPSFHLFGTFRKRGKPNNVKVAEPSEVGCANTACCLIATKQIIKNGRCPTSGCNVTNSDLVYRHEQKIVDTMLTCDILFCAMRSYSFLLLISEDDDFLPPIRTALLRGSTVYRIHPFQNRQRVPMKAATNLHELEL